MTRILEIHSCKECPHKRTKPQYTADSFEHNEKWLCHAAKDKIIAQWIEWSKDEPKGIPKWCPLKKGKVNE